MVEYNKDRPLKVATAFSGYDSQKMALERLHNAFPDFCFELVAWSEIDENAIAAHNAIFPEDKSKNLGDISKIDWAKAPDFDLFTYSFPCQDISAAGKQSGFEEGTGTRSSLLWECKKTIEAKKPRYLMMENVKALASAKFLPFLRQWQSWLHSQGYENFTQVLNASDYEVPQNRERVFMISILRTDNNPYPSYYFPKKLKLEKRIKHILEQNVDESYYLSQKALEYFCRAGQRFEDKFVKQSAEPKIVGYTRDKKGEVVKRSLRDISNTVTTFTGSGHNTDMYAAEPKIVASRGRGEFNRQQLEINENGTSNALTSVSKDNMLAVSELRCIEGCMVDKYGNRYRVRKLTPKECFRLMDVSDEDIKKMESSGVAKTNLYKLAGNSIVVACMFHIFRKLFVEKGNENPQLELF